jgi:hypothetical protein
VSINEAIWKDAFSSSSFRWVGFVKNRVCHCCDASLLSERHKWLIWAFGLRGVSSETFTRSHTVVRELVQADSTQLVRRCGNRTMFSIIGIIPRNYCFFYFSLLPVFQKTLENTTFRKLDLFSSSDEGGGNTYSVESLNEELTSVSGHPTLV